MDAAPTADWAGSGDSPPAELRRAGWLGRFPQPTEAAYRAWAIAQALPLVRLIGWFSVLIWLLAPFIGEALWDATIPWQGWALCWGVNVPAIVTALLVARTRPRIWYAAAVLTLVMFGSLLLVHWVDAPSGPAAMVSLTIFMLYLAPVMRFPFRTTVVVIVLTVPATFASVFAESGPGPIDRVLYFQLWLLVSTCLFALGMTLLAENEGRSRYADERLLAQQQQLLADAHELVRRYAPAAVADRLEHGDNTVGAAQRRRVTIFFADVVGFTALADQLDPEALAEVMNDYLGSVAEVVERHGGTLNEFAGDGVMAIFGAPEEMAPADQVRAALRTAAEVRTELRQWSSRWYALGLAHDLEARMGVNTGVVSVGTFGSAVRATYTGIGLQTNIAARVQSQCPPGSVLLSGTSWHLIKDDVPCLPRGEVEVKGVHFPIAMYEPV